MSSSDCEAQLAGGGSGQANGAGPSPFENFLSDIVDLALSVDQRLAAILHGGDAIGAPRLPWTKGRMRGLELCLVMLRYAREEPMKSDVSQRLDQAIEHVVGELARGRLS